MQKATILIVLLVASCFAKLNPDSEESVAVPYDEDSFFSVDDGLVTNNFGVVSTVYDDGSVVLYPFSVGDETDFISGDSFNVSDRCNPQLLNVNTSAFILFCADPFGEIGFTMNLFSVDEDGDIELVQNQTFEKENPTVSHSSFVTVGGNVYVASTDDDGVSNVTIYRFNVDTFDLELMIEDAMTLFNDYLNGSFLMADFHSLPFDSGVAMLLHDDDIYSAEQYLALAYFNKTVAVFNLTDVDYTYYAVGRHKGSSFGYTLADSDTPYTTVTAWDFSATNLGPTNDIQVKGWSPYSTGHFATQTSVYVYTVGDDGYVNELPYSERGFLPNSANSVTAPLAAQGALVDGVDGTHAYCFSLQNETTPEQVYLTRWTY